MNENIDYKTEERENAKRLSLQQKDLIAGVVLFVFGLYSFLSGIHMCFVAVTGTKVWYYSPGFLPAFIGLVIMLLTGILVYKNFISGARITSEDLRCIFVSLFNTNNWKLIAAIALLAIYIFVLIGRVPFVVATFMYLTVNFITFRPKDFAIWKLVLISTATTAVVYVFFGIIAAIPLP